MSMLLVNLMVSEEFAANLPADAALVVLAMPQGGLDTLKAALAYTAKVSRLTRERVAAVKAVLDDPAGTPEMMTAALAELVLLAEAHVTAEGNLAATLALLDTAIVTQLGAGEPDGRALQ